MYKRRAAELDPQYSVPRTHFYTFFTPIKSEISWLAYEVYMWEA